MDTANAKQELLAISSRSREVTPPEYVILWSPMNQLRRKLQAELDRVNHLSSTSTDRKEVW